MIGISEVAVEKLKQSIAKKKNPENIMVRIVFAGVG